MAEQSHWFHCTQDYHGQTWTAKRIAPVFCDKCEPPTPRLCVASSVAACFAARLFTRGDVYVYRTATPRRSIAPRGVYDAVITGERWLVPPVDMVLTHVVQECFARTAQEWLRLYLTDVRRPCDVKLRIAAYLEVVTAFQHDGPPFITPFDRRFVRMAAKRCKIADGAEAFLDAMNGHASRMQALKQEIYG